MAVVYDSRDHAPQDRADVARAVFEEQSAPSTVAFVDSPPMAAVMEAWRLGDNHLFCASMTSNRLRRSAHDVRRGPTGIIGIAVQTFGVAQFEQQGFQQVVRPGDMVVVDLDSPYEFGWAGWGRSRCLQIPTPSVGLTGTQLRDAARRVAASPLYGLVRRHINDLCIDRDIEVPDLAANALGSASITLIRTLLVSADLDADSADDPDLFIVRANAFLVDHLADPGLTVDAIADHLGMRVSEVTRLAAAAGVDVPRWIEGNRLNRVHTDLLHSPSGPDLAFARAHGFTDLASLDASFRNSYGLAPRTWWEIRREQ